MKSRKYQNIKSLCIELMQNAIAAANEELTGELTGIADKSQMLHYDKILSDISVNLVKQLVEKWIEKYDGYLAYRDFKQMDLNQLRNDKNKEYPEEIKQVATTIIQAGIEKAKTSICNDEELSSKIVDTIAKKKYNLILLRLAMQLSEEYVEKYGNLVKNNFQEDINQLRDGDGKKYPEKVKKVAFTIIESARSAIFRRGGKPYNDAPEEPCGNIEENIKLITNKILEKRNPILNKQHIQYINGQQAQKRHYNPGIEKESPDSLIANSRYMNNGQ